MGVATSVKPTVTDVGKGGGVGGRKEIGFVGQSDGGGGLLSCGVGERRDVGEVLGHGPPPSPQGGKGGVSFLLADELVRTGPRVLETICKIIFLFFFFFALFGPRVLELFVRFNFFLFHSLEGARSVSLLVCLCVSVT
jgi:hypothetical protein